MIPVADPNKRLIGAMMGGLTGMIMFIIAAIGVIRACLTMAPRRSMRYARFSI
jgi:hypothetical protein